jgi:hypothetical protein
VSILADLTQALRGAAPLAPVRQESRK